MTAIANGDAVPICSAQHYNLLNRYGYGRFWPKPPSTNQFFLDDLGQHGYGYYPPSGNERNIPSTNISGLCVRFSYIRVLRHC